MTSRDKEAGEYKESHVKAEIGCTISRDYHKAAAQLLQSYWPHTALRTGGHFKPIYIDCDSFSWLLFEVLLKKNTLSPRPHYKRHSFEVRMKTSVSPESRRLHTNSSPVTMTHTFKMSTNWHTCTNGVFSVALRDALQHLVPACPVSLYRWRQRLQGWKVNTHTHTNRNFFKPTCSLPTQAAWIIIIYWLVNAGTHTYTVTRRGDHDELTEELRLDKV